MSGLKQIWEEFWQVPGRLGQSSSPDSDLVYDQLRRTCAVASVLDVGCGSGHLVYKLLENGADAYGVDLSHIIVKHAAGWAPERFLQADGQNLPFVDEAFDTVAATHVLDSTPQENVTALIREFHRVSRRFVFAIVSQAPFGSREAWDRLFIKHGFRRHPLEVSGSDERHIVLAYEKASITVQESGDVLLQVGLESDARIARYQLAASYVRSGDVVLDAGCGVGYGNAILAAGSLAAKVACIDVRDLSQFMESSVDMIVSFGTVDEIADPERFFAEAARVLTPGGRFIGSLPASALPVCRKYLIVERSSEGVDIAVKDPRSGTRDDYRETVYAEAQDVAPNVTAYARDYANPWLVRSLVNISSRFRSPDLLKEMAVDLQEATELRGADLGAALCVEGYQLIRNTFGGVQVIDGYLTKAARYLDGEPDSVHAYRWHLSIQFLIGKIQLLVGRRSAAKETFRALSERDALPFSPLLGTKTIGAAFYAGWLSALDGDIPAAKTAWQRGVTETHRLLQGDWREIWGKASNPLPFALTEVGDMADVGARCAIALKYADRLQSQPALFWRLIEEHSKSLQSESNRLRTEHHFARKVEDRGTLSSALAIVRAASKGRPIFIWGAGSLGTQLAHSLVGCGIVAAGFIDSDTSKAGTRVQDLPVTGPDVVRPGATVRPFVMIGSTHVDAIRHALLVAGMCEGEDFTGAPDMPLLREMTGVCRDAVKHAANENAKAPRCLMYYPWNLDESSGALSLLLSYSRALKDAGYRLDCYAARSAPNSLSGGLFHGVFENVFSPPDGDSPVTRHLECIGGICEDSELPEKVGRDEASMVAAGVLAAVSNYDVIGIHYTRCHSLKLMLPPGMPVVLFTHDIDSLVRRQQAVIDGEPAEYALEAEASRLKPFDLVTVVGPSDREAFHSVAPELPIVEAPFTLREEDVAVVREDSPGVLLWVSSAAPFHRLSFQWFWNWVWPTIRAARPECRLVIAGRLSEVAEDLGAGADAQVSILGVVEDLDRLYREADVFVAPYYYGLGIKTKVIEAFAKGIPVVTTTLGIHNTHVQPGREALVADDAAAYANHVIELVSCPARRAELVRDGREYLRRRHNPEQSLEEFVSAFDGVRRKKKLSSKARAGAVRELSGPLRHLVPWVIQRCLRDGVRSVVLYGAGSHTRLLIPIWKAMGGLPITTIVVSGEVTEPTCLGIPVVSAAGFEPAQDEGIVLSSQEYEHAMSASCRERWPQVKSYTIWKPLHQPQSKATAEFDAPCHEKIPTALYELEGSYENTASLPV